jgi:[ribosomal protein S18]-alanine N-acetyltransferase
MSDDNNAAIIRPANTKDIPAIMTLDRGCTSAVHWTEHQYQQIFQLGIQGLVLVAQRCLSNAAEDAGRVLGFLVARQIGFEWELENMVVDPGVRRNGLGNRLVQALLAEARQTRGDRIFLEVRESNAAARTLYEKAGFRQTGRRKLYYAGPSEDAILYRCQLD